MTDKDEKKILDWSIIGSSVFVLKFTYTAP